MPFMRVFATLLLFLSTPTAQAQSDTVDFVIQANGLTGRVESAYDMRGQIDTQNGAFEGSYEFDVPGGITAGTWRAAAKRGWDLKLRWGTPANPPPIAVLGNFELTIESWTTMNDTGARFPSEAVIGGGPERLSIDLTYKEPAPHGGEEGRQQTSYSTFAGDGPGRILFQTSHHDDAGEFAVTRGVIHLNGAPEAELAEPVHTQFTMVFEPGKDAHKGRFNGQTEVVEHRPDLPDDQTVDRIFAVPVDEQKYCCSLVCPTLNPSSCQMKCEEKGDAACAVFTLNCPNKIGQGGCKFE